ncbi:type II toxin-antitoxin system VapC family toxin [Thiofilum flexile]|uniref:type II toxin-antitoxin system VapC family toxin n=1 Tax=Thiofilum flexile TaxID=125627 RepID=UPI0003635FCB|nr:type II toxin-antitoxin system VapC family toxin [Thiofilum flexile]
MFLLDTNVLSELMKLHPEPKVMEWIDAQLESDLYFCAISKGEIEWGIALLPEGKRKHALAEVALQVFILFEGRCLAYSCEVSPFYRDIAITAKQLGRPMSVEDGMIAAIAQANNAVLVTRNEVDFDFLPNLTLVNPWV